MDWQQIQQSFRGSFEGALWAFVLLILLGISLPILSHIWTERFQRFRKLRRIQRQFSAKGINPQEWRLLEDAIRSTCPENPDRLLDSVSLFHTWVDGLPDIDSAEPELLQTLQRIKEMAYPESGHVFVPHSTRDLSPGVSLNLGFHKGGQEVIPCIVVEVGMDGLRLSPRGSYGSKGAPGEQLSLFYPRPEAMYHAVVRLKESPGGELRVSHAQQGQFRVRQLREFWRVDVDMEVAFIVMQEPGKIFESEAGWRPDQRPGHLINLSGNGAALITHNPPPRGSHIAFALNLPSKTLPDLQAEVLHITINHEISRLHLVFRNLDPGDQELIIRNLFMLYREQTGFEPVADSGPVLFQTRG